MTIIHPVILSGGSGTRLWPLSRRAYPKQFLKLLGGESLLQATCRRLEGDLFAPPSIFGNHEHRFIIGDQLDEIGVRPERIVLEPAARNTAPVVATAALIHAQSDEDALILLLPSDHVIADHQAFGDCVRQGMAAAQAGSVVTFGVTPDSPHTGYGYLECAPDSQAPSAVTRFIEKPGYEDAERFLESGRHFWNAGIFLFSAGAMIRLFEKHAPDILAACRGALAKAETDFDFLRLDAHHYAQAANISVDYAIMEKASDIRCVPLTTQWSDLGSWSALWDILDKDEAGNASLGEGTVIFQDARNSFGYSELPCLSVVGLEDVLVVAVKDAVLVASKQHAQSVTKVVDALKAQGRDEVTWHKRVFRPWGWFEGLSEGDRYQVKCLMVKPGGRLSLQSHHHRAEHWVVVKGTAEVTVGNETKLLTENQSTYVPLGEVHRLANTGKVPAYLIEVQSGSYLGEDDIVRFDDVYGRTPQAAK